MRNTWKSSLIRFLKPIRDFLYPIKFVWVLFLKDFKRVVWYQYFPKKPVVINMNVNDICNSGCVMCNIWKQKKEFEISPDELYTVLQDPLYSEVQHIGMTGGEPTLRKDLPALYESAILALPKLRGVSIITNAINEKEVLNNLRMVAALCEKYKMPFSIMVSLDGVGEVHDRVRGKQGNFDKAIRVIKFLKGNFKNPISIGCTISKENVWHVNELLEFMKNEGIYGRFRIAEFINRLYNKTSTNVIRNFDADEVYHLQLFFMKLSRAFEQSGIYRRTYSSIVAMLDGGKRKIGCPYQSEGVVLNSKGELAYCAPKSNLLGNGLQRSSLKIFENNLRHRRNLLKNDCSDCIHDYHHELTLKEYLNEKKRDFWRSLISPKGINKSLLFSNGIPKSTSTNSHCILIVGWYGTETVGDKAILGGIVQSYSGPLKVYVASIHPIITRRTIVELKIDSFTDVIDVYSADFLSLSKSCDEIIMGGGPLMDMDELSIPLIAFGIGKKFMRRTKIFGCGIGPLRLSRNIDMVRNLVRLSDEVLVRDSKSKGIIDDWNLGKTVSISGDPARAYIQTLAPQINTSRGFIACFLREWPVEYFEGELDSFEETKTAFEAGLAQLIKQKANEYKTKEIKFCHMHIFDVGGDDRDFSRKFVSEYFDESEFQVVIDNGLSSVDSIIGDMCSSSFNICMRFHSVLFAHTLGTKFTAVDYTEGGKIDYYLSDNNMRDHMVSVSDIKAVTI